MLMKNHMGCRYRVDAWLERVEPEVRILDNQSGAVLLDWGSQRLGWLVDHGYLGYEDFIDFRSEGTEQFVEELIALDHDLDQKTTDWQEGVWVGDGLTPYHFSEYQQCCQNLISLGI